MAGGEPKRLTEGVDSLSSLVVSPDGRHVAGKVLPRAQTGGGLPSLVREIDVTSGARRDVRRRWLEWIADHFTRARTGPTSFADRGGIARRVGSADYADCADFCESPHGPADGREAAVAERPARYDMRPNIESTGFMSHRV